MVSLTDKDKPQDEPQDSTKVDQGPQDPQCEYNVKHETPLLTFPDAMDTWSV